jgi:glycine cleavage system H lipoate-binding protein
MMVALLVLLTVIVFLTVDYFAQRSAARRAAPATAPPPVAVRLPADLAALPGGLFVGPGHAWVGLEPSGEVRIGADRLAATLLGGLDGVVPAAAGSRLRRGDPVARLHRGGRAIEIPSPVEGVVTATNPRAAVAPGELAAGPVEESWFALVAPVALDAALKELRVAEEGADWLRRELTRLRDFLVDLGARHALPAPTLADGGLPLAGIAARLGDAEWADLVARFFGRPS